MKLILAFFLCGVVYATALPTCSEKELDQCESYPDGDDAYKETEAFLNEVCRSVGCWTNYKKRCDTTDLLTYTKLKLKQSEKIYNAMCGKNKPMRQKYLDNAKCIIRVTKDFVTSCKPWQPVFDRHDPKFCQEVEEYITCTTNLLFIECGSDAREVYEASAPDLEFYGC